MDALRQFFDYILSLGPSLVIALVIFLLGLIVGVKPGRSFRAGFTIGVAFIGISLVVDLLIKTLGPVTQAMVTNTGVKLDVVDIGWPVAAAVAFGTSALVPWVFLLGILLNVVLLAFNFTKTLNVDMWNYWHMLFAGAIVATVTQNVWLGVLAALTMLTVLLVLADWTAPIVDKFFGLPGISFAHGNTVAWAPLGWLVNKIIDAIPGLRDWRADPEDLQARFGVFGEPAILGAILGLILGLLGYGNKLGTELGETVKVILNTSISLGADIFLMPRVVRILMEGLLPFSEGVREFMSSRFPGREVYIGIDAAAAIGHPAVIATGLLLTPICLGLAVLMSFAGWNRMLPFTDLAALPFFAIWAVGWSRGNMVRAVITGTIFSTVILFIATDLAPISTQVAVAAGFSMPEGALQVSTVSIGAEFVGWLLSLPYRLMGAVGGIIGMLVVAAIFIVPLKAAISGRIGWLSAKFEELPSGQTAK